MSIEKEHTLTVTEIQRFCMHDGPGVRTTVFLKGCPLRCQWCHNPETQSAAQQIMFYVKKCIHCGACEAVCPNGAQKMQPIRCYDREKCGLCGKCVQVCCREALSFALNEMPLEEVMALVLLGKIPRAEVTEHEANPEGKDPVVQVPSCL